MQCVQQQVIGVGGDQREEGTWDKVRGNGYVVIELLVRVVGVIDYLKSVSCF